MNALEPGRFYVATLPSGERVAGMAGNGEWFYWVDTAGRLQSIEQTKLVSVARLVILDAPTDTRRTRWS